MGINDGFKQVDLQMEIDFGSIMRDIVKTYKTFFAMMLELEQNAIDARPKRAEILIDLQRGRVTCMDNGDGCTLAEFQQTLKQLCKTQKRAGKLGKFGRGQLSPLNKCQHFTFTSAPRANKGNKSAWPGYRSYSFDAVIADLRKNKAEVTRNVPSQVADMGPDLPWWNTRTEIANLTVPERQLANFNLQDFKEESEIRYSAALADNRELQFKVSLVKPDGSKETVILEPKQFHGRALPLVKLRGEYCGEIQLRLFLNDSPIDGRNLLVECGDKSRFQMSWSSISAQSLAASKSKDAGQISIDNEIRQILDAGYFEGLMYVKDCNWNEERTGLAEDEPLMDFYIQLQDWVRSSGMELVKRVQTKDKQTRREELALEVANHLKGIMEGLPERVLDAFMDLPTMVTKGHSPVPQTGRGEQPTVRTLPKRERKPSGGGHGGNDIPKRHLGGVHIGATGGNTGGSERVVTKTDVGFVIECGRVDVATDRFGFRDPGIIVINYTHPEFSHIEDNEPDKLKDYILRVATYAVCHLTMPDEFQGHSWQFQDIFFPMLNGGAGLTRRKKGRPPKNS